MVCENEGVCEYEVCVSMRVCVCEYEGVRVCE